ncbi:class I SAM-dependent methyltransferase [Bacteroidota bacterium]
MKFSLNSFIYKHVIDRILSRGQKSVIARLKPSDRVLDVACGTGSLSISMSGVASYVRGIDLSEEMIDIAKYAASKKRLSNVEFSISDASKLSMFNDNTFDIAVTSMAVHQFDPDLAVQILKEMKRIARRIIIMDYYYPMPVGIYRLVIFIVEWIAGGDHFRNFRKFNKLEGLSYYISEAGFSGQGNDLYKSNFFRVLECP